MVHPPKQYGVAYKIPCKCGKVFIGKTGSAGENQRAQEGYTNCPHPDLHHFRACQQDLPSSALEQDGSLFIKTNTGIHAGSRTPSTSGYTPSNINRDNGKEIPASLIPMIKKHNRRPEQLWTAI